MTDERLGLGEARHLDEMLMRGITVIASTHRVTG
jgi:hypothetical protein